MRELLVPSNERSGDDLDARGIQHDAHARKEVALRHAIAERQLFVVYQPIVWLGGEHAPRVCGARGGAAPGVGGGNKAAPAEHQPRGQCLQEDGRLALRTERVDGRVKMRKQRPLCQIDKARRRTRRISVLNSDYKIPMDMSHSSMLPVMCCTHQLCMRRKLNSRSLK